MTDLDRRRAGVFGQVAEAYHRWRPSYPAAAIDWLPPLAARDVLDLGTGTGKLTALLAQRDLCVHAVEPDPQMLAVLRQHLPDVTSHLAGADRLPLPDAGLDAVLVADAWHWFPHEQAVAETRRVLRPGARRGLLWTTPNMTTGWSAQLAALDPDAEARQRPPQASGLPQEEVERATFDWTWLVDADTVAGVLATNSAYLRADPDLRDRQAQQASDIVAAACQAAGAATVPWPQRTMCFRWQTN